MWEAGVFSVDTVLLLTRQSYLFSEYSGQKFGKIKANRDFDPGAQNIYLFFKTIVFQLAALLLILT